MQHCHILCAKLVRAANVIDRRSEVVKAIPRACVFVQACRRQQIPCINANCHCEDQIKRAWVLPFCAPLLKAPNTVAVCCCRRRDLYSCSVLNDQKQYMRQKHCSYIRCCPSPSVSASSKSPGTVQPLAWRSSMYSMSATCRRITQLSFSPRQQMLSRTAACSIPYL